MYKFQTQSISIRNAVNDYGVVWDENPPYQRPSGQFSIKEKRLLIETILDGYPIGGQIFLGSITNDEQYTHVVLDGKQRLSVLSDFLNNKFKFRASDEKWHFLNDKYFKDFDVKYKTQINNFTLTLIILDAECEEYHNIIFGRINSTVHKLNKQQLLNGENSSIAASIKEICSKNISFFQTFSNNNTKNQYEDNLSKFLSKTLYVGNKLDNYVHLKRELYDITDEEKINDIRQRCNKILPILEKIITLSECKVYHNMVDGLFKWLYLNEFSRKRIEENISNIVSEFNEYWSDEQWYNENVTQGATKTVKLFSDRYNIAQKIMSPYAIEKDSKRNFPISIKKWLWDNCEHRCNICGEEISCFEECEVDHIKPYSEGGKTELSNAQIVHKYCNRLKSNNYDTTSIL